MIHGFVNRCFGRTIKVLWSDNIPNCKLWKQTRQEQIKESNIKTKMELEWSYIKEMQ